MRKQVIVIWNEPSLEDLLRIPNLYATEGVSSKDKLIYEHFFLFGCDWYIAEFESDTGTMFGYAILNNDYQNSEWGYVNFQELKDINVKGFEVERDKYWITKPAGEIERIVDSGGIYDGL